MTTTVTHEEDTLPSTSEQITGQSSEKGELSHRLRDVVAAHLQLNPADLKDHLELGNDLCMDSLAAAELLVVIEDDLGVPLDANVLAGREKVTYGELDQLVCERAEANG